MRLTSVLTLLCLLGCDSGGGGSEQPPTELAAPVVAPEPVAVAKTPPLPANGTETRVEPQLEATVAVKIDKGAPAKPSTSNAKAKIVRSTSTKPRAAAEDSKPAAGETKPSAESKTAVSKPAADPAPPSATAASGAGFDEVAQRARCEELVRHSIALARADPRVTALPPAILARVEQAIRTDFKGRCISERWSKRVTDCGLQAKTEAAAKRCKALQESGG